ncbi:MAG: hypothetical protein HQL70_05965 [Magnetococcales bacterium]|nr:hypothetical protein [Magnetococcales bacterium]
MVYRVAVNFPELAANDSLLLQTRSGEVIGRVVYVSSDPTDKSIDPSRLFTGKITRIIRKLSSADLQSIENNREIEKRAKLVCRQTIRELKLAMKLAKVTYQQSSSKILFHFTSEGRVDFRELVRQLGTKLKTRIEMRHVGVRDETRLLSGIGPCGKELCCSQFLQKFHPVSVRMAKNQDLSLNPDGISGVCGRLLCCLAYENDTYVELKKGLPKVRKCCWTADGKEATVKSVHTLTRMVTLQRRDGTYETLPANDVSKEKPETPIKGANDQDLLSSKEVPVGRIKQSTPNKKTSDGSAKTSAKPSNKPDAEQDDKAAESTSKSQQRRKSRRRRRKRSKGQGGGDDGLQQNQQPQQAGSTENSQPEAKASQNPAQGGEVKDGGSASKTGQGKRRRRRRRRGGNRGGGGEGGASSSTPAPAS